MLKISKQQSVAKTGQASAMPADISYRLITAALERTSGYLIATISNIQPRKEEFPITYRIGAYFTERALKFNKNR
jgi:hypothetical protein